MSGLLGIMMELFNVFPNLLATIGDIVGNIARGSNDEEDDEEDDEEYDEDEEYYDDEDEEDDIPLNQVFPESNQKSGDFVVDRRRSYAWLVRNTKQIRHAMSQRLSHMKTVPNLTFVLADVGAAVDVMNLIDKVSKALYRFVDSVKSIPAIQVYVLKWKSDVTQCMTAKMNQMKKIVTISKSHTRRTRRKTLPLSPNHPEILCMLQ